MHGKRKGIIQIILMIWHYLSTIYIIKKLHIVIRFIEAAWLLGTSSFLAFVNFPNILRNVHDLK